MLPSLEKLDSNERYWLLHTIYSTHSDAEDRSRDATTAKWSQAAAEGRIKTRKNRNRGSVKVWIEPKVDQKEAA